MESKRTRIAKAAVTTTRASTKEQRGPQASIDTTARAEASNATEERCAYGEKQADAAAGAISDGRRSANAQVVANAQGGAGTVRWERVTKEH
jgi:hypothetical protein